MNDRQFEREIEAFAGRLGYRFQDIDLLTHALTHASARHNAQVERDYERLEFLGDRVLGLIAAELLFRELPEEPEGNLARRLNRLVRAETCAILAEALKLGDALLLSPNERMSGGATNPNILADAFESVLGAVFLDGGFEPVRSLVQGLFRNQIGLCDAPPVDPKSALQEWAQGRGLALPRYVETGRSGPDHDPDFVIEVRVDGFKASRGQGKSKRAAQSEAAESFLLREQIWEQGADA